MRVPSTWIDRSPGWPPEKLLIFVALAGIMLWGFSGSWEYPTVETSIAAARQGVRAVVPTDPAGAGAELFQANGCYACHSLDGERKIGPSLLGIFGTTVELDDGSALLIDDDYLAESILEPQAKLVAGYGEAAMPSYQGLVSDADVAALVEYIKSLN